MKLPNIQIEPNSLPPFVLMPGDPQRVQKITEYLTDIKPLSSYREFVAVSGHYKNIPIAVISTGIGCPSTAIAVEEAIIGGAKVLIRVGTCGGAWRKDIPCGSLVIPSASVRDEGTTIEYIDSGFPAIASLDVVDALARSANEMKFDRYIGINRTHDAYYGKQSAITRWGEYLQEGRFKECETPILTSEMEASALFVIATLRGVRSGCVLAVNADPEPLRDRLSGKYLPVVSKKSKEASDAVVEKAIQVALEAIVKIDTKFMY